MGWNSGVDIFDRTVKAVLEDRTLDDEEKMSIIRPLIESLWRLDWDNESDSDYWEEPLIRQCFRELDPHFFEGRGE